MVLDDPVVCEHDLQGAIGNLLSVVENYSPPGEPALCALGRAAPRESIDARSGHRAVTSRSGHHRVRGRGAYVPMP